VQHGGYTNRKYYYDSCPSDAPACHFITGRPVKVDLMTTSPTGVTLKEFFSYHQSGALRDKTLRYLKNGKQGDLTLTYGSSNEGKVNGVTYPSI
jgi:hypothetical protein